MKTFNWSTEDTEYKAYFGLIYQYSNKNLELIINQTDGVSNLFNDFELFTLYSANTYTYYCTAAGGTKLSKKKILFIPNDIYNSAIGGIERDILIWQTVKDYDMNPQFAFVATEDGDVTDVVVYY